MSTASVAELNSEQVAFCAILIAAFVLLFTEWLRNDLVALLIVVGLYASGLLTAREALSGFSSQPAIVVACVFVLTEALRRTGVADALSRAITRLAGASPARILLVVMPVIAVSSAFTHHVTTTAVMVPVILEIARKHKVPASRLLLPVAVAASLGTTITVISAPAFLLGSGALRQIGRPGLELFSVAPIGLLLSLTGILYFLTLGRFLLPTRAGGEEPAEKFKLDGYLTELKVFEGSPFIGRRFRKIEQRRKGIAIVGCVRGGRRLTGEPSDHSVQPGDVLLVRASPDRLIELRAHPAHELHPIERYAPQERVVPHDELGDRLVQAVLAPGSEHAGRSLAELGFHRRYGAVVLGLWRRHQWLEEQISDVKLQAGDVLVLMGSDTALDKLRADPAFLLLVPFQAEARSARKAPIAVLAMVLAVAATVFKWLEIEMALLTAVALVLLLRCLSLKQAYQAVDVKIFVFIAGVLPLSAGMQNSGVSALLARGLSGVLGGWQPQWILAAFFVVVALITQMMSDAATTALFAPVAIGVAQALGHTPEPYVVVVAMASVTAMLTPIGHHGSLLVYGPGGYRFSDFVRAGTPLTIIVGVIVVWLAPLLW